MYQMLLGTVTAWQIDWASSRGDTGQTDGASQKDTTDPLRIIINPDPQQLSREPWVAERFIPWGPYGVVLPY